MWFLNIVQNFRKYSYFSKFVHKFKNVHVFWKVLEIQKTFTLYELFKISKEVSFFKTYSQIQNMFTFGKMLATVVLEGNPSCYRKTWVATVSKPSRYKRAHYVASGLAQPRRAPYACLLGILPQRAVYRHSRTFLYRSLRAI